MDVTVEGVDEAVFRHLEMRARMEEKDLGQLLTEAIEAYLRSPNWFPKIHSLADLEPEDFGPGTERLSEQVDEVLYGDDV